MKLELWVCLVVMAPAVAVATPPPQGARLDVAGGPGFYSNPRISGLIVSYETPNLQTSVVTIPNLEPVPIWVDLMATTNPATNTGCDLHGSFIACLASDVTGDSGKMTGVWILAVDLMSGKRLLDPPTATYRAIRQTSISANGLLAIQGNAGDIFTPLLQAFDVSSSQGWWDLTPEYCDTGADIASVSVDRGGDIAWVFRDNLQNSGIRTGRVPASACPADIPYYSADSVSFSERRLVFAVHDQSGDDIVVYDLNTPSQPARRLHRVGIYQEHPRMSGKLVVFTVWDHIDYHDHVEVWDLNGTDDSNPIVWRVPAIGSAQWSPDIDGNRITFIDKRGDDSFVSVFDFTPRRGNPPDDDSDGLPTTSRDEYCPCGADADGDYVCDTCNPSLSWFCMVACKGFVPDSCPGAFDTRANYNYEAELALEKDILDNACDPVFTAKPTPISRGIDCVYGSYGMGLRSQMCTTLPDVLQFHKAHVGDSTVDFVDYRACVQDFLKDPLYDSCSDKRFVGDQWRTQRPTYTDEQPGDPFRRILTEATASNLDAVDATVDARTFHHLNWAPAHGQPYDLPYFRTWRQTEDFLRWGLKWQDSLFWTHVESPLGQTVPNTDANPQLHGEDLGNTYVPLAPPRMTFRIWTVAQATSRRIYLPACLTCPPSSQVYRGDDRILTEAGLLVSVGDDNPAIGWLQRDRGLEETKVLLPHFREVFRAGQAWVGGVGADAQSGKAAFMPLAVAYTETGSPAVLNYLWTEAGNLLDAFDAAAAGSPAFRNQLTALGLDALPPPSDREPRDKSTVLYSRAQGLVMWVGGTTQEGFARDVLTYNLLSREWSQFDLEDEARLGAVAAATYVEKDSAIWAIDTMGDQNRLVRIDLIGKSARVIASTPGGGLSGSHFMSVDTFGNVMIACGAKDDAGVVQVGMLEKEPQVFAQWALPSEPLMEPIADLDETRIALQDPEDSSPLLVNLSNFDGFSPGDGFDSVVKLCLVGAYRNQAATSTPTDSESQVPAPNSAPDPECTAQTQSESLAQVAIDSGTEALIP